MFNFLRRQKYKKQVFGSLYAVLYLYPRGRDAIVKDYPGIRDAIKSNYSEGTTPQRAALFMAGSILAKQALGDRPGMLPRDWRLQGSAWLRRTFLITLASAGRARSRSNRRADK
jgi:hypothetical protein